MKLVEAQEGRRILDRLVGWETSPILWRVFGRGQAASAGRVQSVAVRMVVERERARMRSAPGSGTTSKARSSRRPTQSSRSAPRSSSSTAAASPKVATSTPRPVSSRDGRDVVLLDGDAARPRSPTGCATCPSAVASVDSDPFTERPRAPFTTSTLQQESGRKLRFTRGAHDGGRAAALRAGLHHVHADRQHEPVGAGDHRGAQPRSASSTATTTCPPSRARTAAR